MKDTPDTNVHFVKMIEINPCVYNRKCREFSNKKKQDETWKMIGKKFDATVPECKERWKNLRACFTRHLKLRASPGYSAITKKPYYLAQHLMFIKPFTKSRRQIGSGNISAPSTCSKHETSEKDDLTDNNLSEDEQHNDESTVMDEDNDQNIQDSSDTNFTQTEREPQLLTSVTTQPMVSAKRHWDDIRDANESVVNYFKKRTTETQRHDDEDLDLCFFKSLLPDIRQMNPDQKRRFKVGIINLSGTILNEEVPSLSLSDYNNIKRAYENTQRPNRESSTLSFNSLTQNFIKPPETNKGSFSRPTLSSDSSTQKKIFPLVLSKQSIQCIPQQEEVPSTTHQHETLEYQNIENRPNSALSSLSSESSILEYKISTEDFEPSSFHSDLKNNEKNN